MDLINPISDLLLRKCDIFIYCMKKNELKSIIKECIKEILTTHISEKKIHPSKYTNIQWRRKYSEYVRHCRKSPWKIDDDQIADFDEFKRNTLDPKINTSL